MRRPADTWTERARIEHAAGESCRNVALSGQHYNDALVQTSIRYADLVARGATIVFATDADPAGDELATKLHALAPPGVVVLRERPSAKDWNDLLQQRARDYSRPRRGLS